MPDIYVIMGDRDVKKSSTIRALTGAARETVFEVATEEGNIDVFIKLSSLQESGEEPEEFINEVTDGGYSHVLISLWIRQRNEQLPDGLTYIHRFLDAGWNIRQIVVLGAEELPYELPQAVENVHYIPDAENMPTNQIAHQIREWWRWL